MGLEPFRISQIPDRVKYSEFPSGVLIDICYHEP